MKKIILFGLAIGPILANGYDKICREESPQARYVHPFPEKGITYQFSLGIKEESNYPTLCYVHLTAEDKKVLWQKLSTIRDKKITKELLESFSSDSVVFKVLADFKEKNKHNPTAISELLVNDVMNALRLQNIP